MITKNIDHYLNSNFSVSSKGKAFLSLIQPAGGRITRQDIDVIKKFPRASEIAISGLTQDTFDYFIENYGKQFKAIVFWKCPLVGNLELLAHLMKIEYIVYFWNQRAEQLWDFSKTKSLKGFAFDDFTRMHDISQISMSPSLEELHFGDKIWTKYILNTLNPIKECSSLKYLSFSARKILDERIEPIAQLRKLEYLSFPLGLFTTEQIAWLKAHLPNTVTSKVLNAYWIIKEPIPMNGKNKDTVIVGKRKPFLDSIQDKEKIKKYTEKFAEMYLWYLKNPKASPWDFSKAS